MDRCLSNRQTNDKWWNRHLRDCKHRRQAHVERKAERIVDNKIRDRRLTCCLLHAAKRQVGIRHIAGRRSSIGSGKANRQSIVNTIVGNKANLAAVDGRTRRKNGRFAGNVVNGAGNRVLRIVERILHTHGVIHEIDQVLQRGIGRDGEFFAISARPPLRPWNESVPSS